MTRETLLAWLNAQHIQAADRGVTFTADGTTTSVVEIVGELIALVEAPTDDEIEQRSAEAIEIMAKPLPEKVKRAITG